VVAIAEVKSILKQMGNQYTGKNTVAHHEHQLAESHGHDDKHSH
jgi:hypothetical protein